MPVYDWEGWLRDWNAMLLGGDPEPDTAEPHVTAEILASGWLGAPGATEEQVAAVETRLGVPLPPSYRSFLLTSNGFLQPTNLVPRLLSTDEVDWFSARHQDVINAWSLGVRLGGSAANDPASFEHYLPTALQVSEIEHGGTAVYLLNPRVVDESGEWEAFYFAHWIPGVVRFPSFSALMEEEMSNWEQSTEPMPPGAAGAAETHSDVKTWWETVRWIFGGKGSGTAGARGP